MANYRIEKDSMGELEVPENALYGAQTQRALNNFPISGIVLPQTFISALAQIKQACAKANYQLGQLDESHYRAISDVCAQVIDGKLNEQFPLDVFQTGSATSTNMNMNEVVANLASQKVKQTIHPNDHVNMSQSSNDVIPTAIHLSATLQCYQQLKPAILHLIVTLNTKANSLNEVVTTGRTHLMDAMPISLGQELSGWSAQLQNALTQIEQTLPALAQLAIGGTAVGTGINAAETFGEKVCHHLSESSKIKFSVGKNRFALLSSQDSAVALSGQLKTLAVAMMKISNDLRWMNSGPLAGIGEIALPALQPGSSIMPGKVNPVIAEATTMVCAQVIGNDATITVAGQSGNFQLNVMLPLVAYNLLQSIELLANSARLLADKVIVDFKVNQKNIDNALTKNPILVTALNQVIGYELGAKIAKQAYAQGRAVIDVAAEMSDLTREQLEELLDPRKLI